MHLCGSSVTPRAADHYSALRFKCRNGFTCIPAAARRGRRLLCRSTRSTGKREQQRQPLAPDDPVLSYYAEFANVPPEAFHPPSTVVELALDAALEREDAPELLQDGLYQARIGTAAVIQDVFRRTRARDVRLKICTTLVGEVMQEIQESSAWRELQATMQQLEAAAGPSWSWSQFERIQVYCLGSIEANAQYRDMFPRPPPFGRTDVYRGWIASRALWQLAFALSLPSLLPGVQSPVCFRDPAFTVFDRRLISAFGGRVQTGDDGGWHPTEVPTFFYAPFCPHSVNERILEANYSPEQLSGLAYVGTCTTFYNELKALWMQRKQQQQQQQLKHPHKQEQQQPQDQQEGQGQQQGHEEQQLPQQLQVREPAVPSDAAGDDSSSPRLQPSVDELVSYSVDDADEQLQHMEREGMEGCGCDGAAEDDDLPDGTVHAASLAAAGVSLEAQIPSIGRIHTPTVRLHIFHQLDRLQQLPGSHMAMNGSSNCSSL